MIKRIKKFSFLIRPIFIVFDLIVINGVIFFYSTTNFFDFGFNIYVSFLWLLLSFYTKFYNVYRYTHILRLITLLTSQFFFYILAFFAYFTIFKEGQLVPNQKLVIGLTVLIISIFKITFFFFLKYYRSSGNNYRNVIVFGHSKAAQNVAEIFNSKNDLGYRFFGFFSDKQSNLVNSLGSIKDGLDFIIKNDIEEIYCEQSTLTSKKLLEVRKFCSRNNIKISLIPENKAIYSKDYFLEYYGTLPILKPKQLPFERIETHFIKRKFDIFFSLIICVFILSWLLPLLWIFVKIDSKGSFLFKQKRDGRNGKQFFCYKIRSMHINKNADKIATSKNDKRVTKVGAFLRKTSLDELPQFFNVLIGDMSIVGPRPHMNIQTKKYLLEVENYLVRNSVKPGITGLAQISGYRGEIIKKSDIENRVRLDIFYIENWSFFLDLKIIMQTFLSVFKKQENVY